MEPARRLLGFEAARALARGSARSPCPMDSRDRGPLPRLLGLAWDYRAVCLRVFAGQLASLALGLGALGGSGLAIDVVRRAVDPAAPPVRWPFGIAPPAGWSPARVLVAVVAGALVLATLRARVVYGTAIATGRLIHLDLVPALRARVFDKLLRLGPRVLRAQRQRLDHQPRHRRRAVAALVRRRRAAAGRAAGVHAGRVRRVHGPRARRADGRLPGADAAAVAGDQLVLALGAPRLRAEPRAVRRDGAGDVRGREGHPRHQDVRRARRRSWSGSAADNRAVRDQQEADLPARQPLRADGVVHHRDRASRSCSATAARWWRATR